MTLAGRSCRDHLARTPYRRNSPWMRAICIGINTELPVLMHDFGAGTLYRAEIVSPGAPSVVNVGMVGVPAAGNPPTVDQPGPKQNIEANDGRVSATTVINNGQIYAVQCIDNGGLASVRYMRIDVATNAVLESQTIVDPAGRALTFPSIAVNEFGDVVIGVTGTSTTEFASSYAMVGNTSGGITNFASPILLKAGVSDYLKYWTRRTATVGEITVRPPSIRPILASSGRARSMLARRTVGRRR